MKETFFELTDHALASLRGAEVVLANFAGERSDFVRFNHALVRQAMTIAQATLTLTLIDRGRHLRTTLALSGERAADRLAVTDAIDAMRRELPSLAPDPYLLYSTRPASTLAERPGQLPTPEEAIAAVVDGAGGTDLVGILASGPVWRGFANSLGQRNWHAVESFQLDWSIYQAGDKAVKRSLAGRTWDSADIARQIASAREQLPYLALPVRAIEPGEYRAYLAPSAVNELLERLNWGGFSVKNQRTRQSPLQMLVDGQARLSDKVSLREASAEGLAPDFDAFGFIKPAAVQLIRAGAHAGALVSPRSAREFGIETDGASDDEAAQSLDLAPGGLRMADVLPAIDRGIYVANLWYLNYSDRPACRITGMTRFATFWVEHGRIAAPLSVMRFDDSLYRMLGSELEALTEESELLQSSSTYGQRALETSRVPGALLAGLRLTL